ncbi:MAG: methyl-accepting chemotaxis protein [Steroidobacteraceae bacterium]
MFSKLANLSLRSKLFAILIAMLIPIVMLAWMMSSASLSAIQVGKDELYGISAVRPLAALTINLAEHRDHVAAVLAGRDEERGELNEHAAAIREAVAELDKVMPAQGATAAATWRSVRAEMLDAADRSLSLSIAASNQKHARLIDAGNSLITDVAASSGLELDPASATFKLMAVSVLTLPKTISAAAEARRFIERLEEGAPTQAEWLHFGDRVGLATYGIGESLRQLQGAAESDTTIAARALDGAKSLGDMQGQFIAELRKLADERSFASATLEDFSHRGELAVERLAEIQTSSLDDLEALLQDRVRADQRTLWIDAAIVATCLSIAVALLFWVSAYLTRKVTAATAAFARLQEGHFDNAIGEQPRDELGRLLTALDGMQSGLRQKIEAERVAAAANSRIKEALDATSANVMVADENLNIAYVNRSAQQLMQNCQADFRKDLPRFDASNLVGQSIDLFHRDPSHQRRLLATLTQTFSSEMTIGGRRMRIVANPVTDGSGHRLGAIVEWFDRTQEVATEQEVGSLVEAVAEGKLDTRIALSGKAGFFETLAKGLNGLVDNVAGVVDEVQKLVDEANRGDLTHRMDLEGKQGLYVRIGSGINALVENMSGVVSQVKKAATEVYRGAEEISAGNANLSQRTEQQASSLEETASSMEEMTSTVKQNADNAGQANQLAMAARDQAEKGGAVVSRAVKAMTEINDSSKRIADIISVIDEIAFQTNLLALNAAVEAARAGEQGRGFAVVASEVRNLAGRSATAAKEIKDLIQESVRRVDEGSTLVTQSGTTLEQIVAAVKKVSDIVAEITAAGREQSAGIDQVNKAVMQLDELTQQNAALVEEATAASQSMADQARILNETMHKYRVAGGDASVSEAPAATKQERRKTGRPWSRPEAKVAAAQPAKVAVANGSDSEWQEF